MLFMVQKLRDYPQDHLNEPDDKENPSGRLIIKGKVPDFSVQPDPVDSQSRDVKGECRIVPGNGNPFPRLFQNRQHLRTDDGLEALPADVTNGEAIERVI